MELEYMGAFFDARVDEYEAHMMQYVDGADRYYEVTAQMLPLRPDIKLLDLGCGTGLELEAIFRRMPRAEVTGIDLSAKMLERLKAKFPDRALTLCQGSYFDLPLGEAAFDAVVSVQSLHHFTPERKRGLFERIRRALRPGGIFVLTDFVAPNDAIEAQCFAEYAALNAREPGVYHFDTPLTAEHDMALMAQAGLDEPALRWREKNTVVMTAKRRDEDA